MTATFFRARQTASPWMLFASVCLHCLLILTVVVFSSYLWKQQRPPEQPVARVSIVSAPLMPVTADTIQHDPEPKADVQIEDLLPLEPEPRLKTGELPRDIIQAKAAPRLEPPTIALKKRKKPPQRVEESKPQPDKRLAAQKPPEKEDPQSVIEKSLAAAKQRVEAGKQESARTRTGGPPVDEESARWFEGVKRLVNSRWSVFGDNRPVERVTVIGVKLANDGRLLEATIKASSGDEVFDSSAMRAVHQAAPFPSIPDTVLEKIKASGGLALKFAPGGMQ